MAQYLGVDVHVQTCYATVMDESGRIVKQEKFRNELGELQRFFKDIDVAEVAGAREVSHLLGTPADEVQE